MHASMSGKVALLTEVASRIGQATAGSLAGAVGTGRKTSSIR
jgi:hypothetical protein